MENLPNLDMEKLKLIFPDRERLYFITIKPAPGNTDNILKICDYMYKKTQEFWIVKCQSQMGFIHYHGMYKIPANVYDSVHFNAAINRKINRDMGFMTVSPVSEINSAIKYIRDKRNLGKEGKYEQRDYYKLCIRE